MFKSSLKLAAILGLVVSIFTAAAASGFAVTASYILTAQQWNVPREAMTIIEIPAIRKTIHEFQATKNSRIMIKYPGGDVGTLWANELRSWLVSLGISAKFIELVPGSANPGQLELLVLKSNP